MAPFGLDVGLWACVLFARGLTSVCLGIMALLWPMTTVAALTILFGAYCVVEGVLALFGGLSGAAWQSLLTSAVSLGAGLVAFFHPGLSALLLLYLIAAWGIARGVSEIAAAIVVGAEIDHQPLLILAGAASVAFGVCLVLLPDAALTSVAWTLGGYAIVFGVLLILVSVRLRSAIGAVSFLLLLISPSIPGPRRRRPRAELLLAMSSRGILLGITLGALTGVFLGERAAVFDVAADGFIKLLQMTVLPLVVVSLAGGIGALRHDQIRKLGRSVGVVLLLLWMLALAAVCLFPLVFPNAVSASFFSTTLVEPPQKFDFVDLYIPANPFRSLADNVVPAVVLFSVVFGIALVSIPRRERLLEILVVVRQALSAATAYVVRLTPFGLFAIAANAAGTLTFEELELIQVYLISYVAVSLLVSLWLLPGLIAVLTPIPHLTVLRATRDAMVTAFMTSSLFVVLPMLTDQAKALARDHGLGADQAEAPNVIVPASFNFPHVGKILTLSFILFAGWYAGAPLAVHEYPQLAATGLLALFGSVNVAVPFLLDLFRIPADTFQLFLATSVVNARFGTLMAAMHTVTVAVIGTWMVAGAVALPLRRLVRYLVISALLVVAVVAGVRAVVAATMDSSYQGARVLLGMQSLREPQRGIVVSDIPHEAAPIGGTALARVRHRGTLRVGILPDSLPFVFVNSEGQLVGFDVEMANKLARELGVRLEFVHVAREAIVVALTKGTCEIVMSGVMVTTDRASQMVFSGPYLDETLAFIVPDHARERFATWDRARQQQPLRIGVPRVAFYTDKIRSELPGAEIVPFSAAEEIFGGRRPLDAVILTAERGSAWTLLYPDLSVVVPTPGRVQVPVAYPVADVGMADFIDAWIDLARKDGTIPALYDHWILGRTAAPRAPRWSVMRNVLHWGD